MRRVGRFALRARGNERPRPQPRWLRRTWWAAGALATIGLLAIVVHLASPAELGRQLRAAVAQRSAEVAAKSGLTIAEVWCEGRERSSAATIAEILAPHYGQGTLGLDAAAIRERLLAVPWVKSATVSAQLPGTLYVRLEEHEAIALWHDGGSTRLVSRAGTLIAEPDLRGYARLKLLQGAGAPGAAAALLELLATAPDIARRVTAARRVGERRWNLYLDGRIEVRLPEDGPDRAWARLVELERQGELSARAIDLVDLRTDAWTAVRLKGEMQDLILGRGT